jgi:hypothetical protein
MGQPLMDAIGLRTQQISTISALQISMAIATISAHCASTMLGQPFSGLPQGAALLRTTLPYHIGLGFNLTYNNFVHAMLHSKSWPGRQSRPLETGLGNGGCFCPLPSLPPAVHGAGPDVALVPMLPSLRARCMARSRDWAAYYC